MTNFNPNRKPDKLPYRPIAECYLIYGDKIVAQDARSLFVITRRWYR